MKYGQDKQVTVFKNVNVVTMNSPEILENQNVIVADGMIRYVGSDDKQALNAVTINADGKYLMPGLADMHVHVNAKKDLAMYLANGVTTIRNMRETKLLGTISYVRNLRNRVNSGKIAGPTIYSTGPIYDDKPLLPDPPFRKGTEQADTKEKVNRLVKNDKQKGYDFIKVYSNLSKQMYEEIIKVSAGWSIPVVGHVPGSVGIELALSLGQNSIEHLTGYDKFINGASVVEEEHLDKCIEMTKSKNIWNCPTLVVFSKYVPTEEFDYLENREGMQYMPWYVKRFWRSGREKMNKTFLKNKWCYLCETVDARKKIVKKLHDAGVGLLLGTDSMDAFVVPGFAAHEELKLLVDAGLTPYEAIRTATVNPAIYMNALDTIGTVSAGKRADLVLVEGNPLENIENTVKIAGVMAKGRWFPKDQLNKMLC